MTGTKKSTTAAKGGDSSGGVFSAEERAAMKERATEVRAAQKKGATEADDLAALQAKIAAMPEPDRGMAERIHAVITASAPGLAPKLWYGMPGYAKDGKVVCFFQDALKFKARYATLGFNDTALLDDGTMWPTSFALTELTQENEATIAALAKRAAGCG